MTENEPIEIIEFKKPLYEEGLRKLFNYLLPSVKGNILYDFQNEGILTTGKPETVVVRACAGDIHFEEKNLTLGYKSTRNNSGLHYRLKLYPRPAQGNYNPLEVALETAKEIRKTVDDFFSEYHKL